jgi:hypothetical protein
MESAVLFPNKLARNFAKISAFDPVCGIGRISKTLRPCARPHGSIPAFCF